MSLPEPSSDALAASRALVSQIRQEINASDGWISFTRFMQLALYANKLGYYAGGSAKLGKDGDFTTAPEITPLFGATLANFVSEIMPEVPLRLLEFGAGSGKLARDILLALADSGRPAVEYAIVELSAELRERQRSLLADFPQVQWLDTPPDAFTGVVLANEVLDAMPVPLLVKHGADWFERGVSIQGETLVYADRACDPALLAQIPDAENLPDGYLTEVHPQQAGFMRSLADMLQNGNRNGNGSGGVAVLIDYGFPAAEYYLSERSAGTLMCHYRHHSHPEPFFYPGLQDITAHVDFTAMARAALESDLSVLGYMSQAAFLIHAGLPQLLERDSPDNARAWLPRANAVQKLTSPAEMGELFKVLIVGTPGTLFTLPERFTLHDRSYRL